MKQALKLGNENETDMYSMITSESMKAYAIL